MGLKKYEIITVGSDKRVRALRSWQVGDRYVNIGDVGGIVYDEKTLSQDGACWLFRGNFGFPGARIGGDSIVDVGETALGATGTPAVDILGSSVIVGSKLLFESEQTAADAVVLTADDFEQGGFNYVAGVNWETMKVASGSYIRSKALMFSGGAPVTVKCAVEGYAVTWYTTDADGIVTGAASSQIVTGAGVSFTIPAGQYFLIRLRKEPTGAIVPADAADAKITFTGTYETKLSIIDSRVEINPATSTGVTSIKPGGTYTFISGAKYPEAIIRNSKVSMNVPGASSRSFRLLGRIIGSTATLDLTAGDCGVIGQYSSVKNLMALGVLTANKGVAAYNIIQATNCDNFKIDPGVINSSALAAAQTANMPFIFQGCNVPNGRFYHHAQIANTYKNIDFALASVDLGKAIASGEILAGSEVEGMYRLYSTTGSLFGGLVEGYDSVKSLNMAGTASSYGTTIYKDVYLNGLFDIAGTNVFGNKARSHPLAQVLNVQPRAVQGGVSTSVVGQTITGTLFSSARVTVPTSLRVNGAMGLKVDNIPAGVEATFVYVNPNNVVAGNSVWAASSLTVASAQLKGYAAYLVFRKADNANPITPEDLAGVTVTVYNGCKIVNTGETAVNMKGNIRVEDNATLINCSLTGSGYFGGNSIAQGLVAEGLVYMKDNAVFAPTISGTPKANILRMTDNASFTGGWSGAGTRLTMSGNTRFDSATNHNTLGIVEMRDNASVSGSGSVAVSGVLVLEDDASIAGGNASISGDITLCGSYNQTVNKTWMGKRVIDGHNAPEYDNNVKTQYDF
nr:MAG TPA: hypothetical protein [Caudoviricetes sp.]